MCSRSTPCHTDEELTEEAAIDELIEDGAHEIEEQEERRYDQDCDDARFVVGERMNSHGFAV